MKTYADSILLVSPKYECQGYSIAPVAFCHSPSHILVAIVRSAQLSLTLNDFVVGKVYSFMYVRLMSYKALFSDALTRTRYTVCDLLGTCMN